MRPGQLIPNDFEVAILERIAAKHPSIALHLGRLRVLSREFTGVGSFTKFQRSSASDPPQEPISLNEHIAMPRVPNGLGAVLFCNGGYPACLEIFAYGDDHWDGIYEGYSIARGV